MKYFCVHLAILLIYLVFSSTRNSYWNESCKLCFTDCLLSELSVQFLQTNRNFWFYAIWKLVDKLRVKVYSLEKDEKPRTHDMDRWSKCAWTVKHWLEMHYIYMLDISYSMFYASDFWYKKLHWEMFCMFAIWWENRDKCLKFLCIPSFFWVLCVRISTNFLR